MSIEFQSISVRYGHIQALKGLSLKVRTGGIFAVLGANGAGKTTLLRSVMGLCGADQNIVFIGQSLRRMPTFKRAQLGIAIVPEGRRLFPDFTVGENLRIGAFRRSDHAEIERDLETALEAFPILKERYNQPARTLSGGEAQMLAIGRALMLRPKLLLLDEPSVGLMPKRVSEIFSMIAQIPARGVTVLIVEQNARKALAIADSVAVLELGSIVLGGSAEEVRDDPRIKAAYLGG
jgi:branched-chain amino acid transport system ATP-binding protein